MSRPLLLDLYCGAGGAAAGYYTAGFEVIGVDHRPQPRYPFEFVECDVFDFLKVTNISAYAAIHASPPCQLFTNAGNYKGREGHVNLIPATRKAIQDLGIPYIIENVPGAPLVRPVVLCGLSLGLNVKRHRLFEANVPLTAPPCPEGHPGDWYSVFGQSVRKRGAGITDSHQTVPLEIGRHAMGISWMNRYELSQAIPPAYTELIGKQLLQMLNGTPSTEPDITI